MNPSKNPKSTSNTTGTRRSTRLLGSVKPPSRDRRRPQQPGPSHSINSEMDDDAGGREQSPRSEASPPPGSSPAELFESYQAEHYLYELMRRFASAQKALTMYECQRCIREVQQLPSCHQKSPWVVAMVGRAHYEMLDYASVRYVTFGSLQISS